MLKEHICGMVAYIGSFVLFLAWLYGALIRMAPYLWQILTGIPLGTVVKTPGELLSSLWLLIAVYGSTYYLGMWLGQLSCESWVGMVAQLLGSPEGKDD